MKMMQMAAMATVMTMAAAGYSQDITVSVDGAPVNFRGTEPIFEGGRVFVPLRGVFEQMGADVRWDPSTRTVSATRGEREVSLAIGERMASINGRPVTMDVPARVIQGSTMVPIRFLSESLGADVRWNNTERMVMIDSYSEGRAQPIRRPNRPRDRDDIPESANSWKLETIEANSVIPVELDTPLSSNESRRGDRFTATLRTDQASHYGVLPAGTRIEGHVASVREKQGKDPGVLDLDFDRIRLPDGRAYDLEGDLISLDNSSVTKDSDGVLRAKSGPGDNRTVYAGYGAGAGLIVGLLTKKPLESTLLGGVLGYLAGEAQRAQNKPADVNLKRGTEFGIRLTEDLQLRI